MKIANTLLTITNLVSVMTSDYLFQIFITTFKMEDQWIIITIDIISLIISMIITEEHGKTIDIIFIDAKQYDGRKDIRKYN